MGHFLVTLTPGQKRPRVWLCDDEYDAETRKRKAKDDGLEAEVHRLATNNIHEAKRTLLRRGVAEDFGYEAGSRNFEDGE